MVALNELFTKKHFNICALDSVLEVMNGTDRSEAYKLLRTLHCVDYSAMPPELRERIPALVNEAMRPKVATCIATDMALQGVQF